MTRKCKPRISVRKSPYKLEGGPMHGHTTWLSCGGTLTFTMHGQTGHYDRQGVWQPCLTSGHRRRVMTDHTIDGPDVPPGKPLRKEQLDRGWNQSSQGGLIWVEYKRGLYLISNRGDIMRAIGGRGTRAGYLLRHTDERGRVWISENGQKMYINVWRVAQSLFGGLYRGPKK